MLIFMQKYPNFDIDIEREQERLRRHDVIIFLHPFYWYSTPSLLKEWQDLVLEYGVAYGEEGTLLHGKLCFNALTAGAPESSYHHGEMNNFTLKELLSPLAQMAQFCGMIYLPPFALFTAREATEEGRLGGHIADWVKTLEALRDNRFNIEKASQQTYLNSDPDSLFEGPSACFRQLCNILKRKEGGFPVFLKN